MASMKALKRLIEGFRSFQKDDYIGRRDFYQSLVAQGQKPEVFLVACADSRVDPAILFRSDPGQVFTVRNVANLVPPYMPSASFHGTSAAMEYAVRDLEVKHIVILGHAHCGGIKAVINEATTDTPMERDFIGSWVSIAEDIIAKPECCEDHVCAEQEGVRVSLKNLETFPWIRSRVEAGTLTIHGWWFDLDHGELWEHVDGEFQLIQDTPTR